MKISQPVLRELDGLVRVEARVQSGAGDAALWFGVEPAHAQWLSTDRADGFLVAQLLLAMKLGEPMQLAAPVSTRLYYNLTNCYQPLMHELLPALQPVPIHAELCDKPTGATGVGSGFSAGIDSFCVIRDHFVQPVPEAFRLTHLIFNNVGSHGTRDPQRARRLFRRRHQQIHGYPDSIGLPFIAVDSNLGELLPMDFEQTHTTRNIAVALILGGLFRRFYYASTFHYGDISVKPTFDAAFADPIALPLLSTESLDIVASGGQYRRTTKTALVAELPEVTRWLNVCTTESVDGKNCSICPKCCRTLLTLEILGRLEQFSGTFDLARWRQVRNRYISASILAPKPRPLRREILKLARDSAYRFSLWQWTAALLLRVVPKPLYRLGRSLRRRIFGSL